MGAGHVRLKEPEWEAASSALLGAYRPEKGDLRNDRYLP